jgi:hypothetical protein
MCLCFFVLNLHKKCQGIAKDTRAVLAHARSYDTRKKRFWALQLLIQKPSQKQQSPFFLCPIQNLKAVSGDGHGHGEDTF